MHTLPAVARLKAVWPECRISWLANTEWMPLLAANPDVDEVVEFPRREFRGWGGGGMLAGWLRKTVLGRRPDLALDFQGLLRTALIGRVSGSRTLVGLGDAREGARWFYQRIVSLPKGPLHAIERYLVLADDALSRYGDEPRHAYDRPIEFPLPNGEPPEQSREVATEFVLLHPYARGKNKSLSESDLQLILRKIRNRQVVLVGRSDSVENDSVAGCLNLLNRTTLPQLIWLLRRASFVVSVDSGPAHLAAALGRPMVAIHSWTDPRTVGPYRPDAWVWKNGRLTQVHGLAMMEKGFFSPRPLELREADIDAIAALATSPSNFSA